MKSISRSVCAKLTCYVRSVNIFPQRQPDLLRRYTVVFGVKGSSHCSSMAGGERGVDAEPLLEFQEFRNHLEEFRHQIDESEIVRMRVQEIGSEIDLACSNWLSSILIGFLSQPTPDGLEKVKVHIDVVREHYKKLLEFIQKSCHGQYHRYHCEWSRATRTAVGLLGFINWVENGSILLHAEAEEKLGFKSIGFSLDMEDYFIGICTMSNYVPHYVWRELAAGNRDCSHKAHELMNELQSIVGMLDLHDDILGKQFFEARHYLRKIGNHMKIRKIGNHMKRSMWDTSYLSSHEDGRLP